MLILLALKDTISKLHLIILNCHISVHIHVSMNSVNMKQVRLKVSLTVLSSSFQGSFLIPLANYW